MAQYTDATETVTGHFGKTLVVYYSLSGHTRKIAETIAAKTGADVYEIKTAEDLKSSPWFYLTLRQRLKERRYPVLQGSMPDFDAYDTIFVGAPVWWYTMATPLYSFLQKADFGGRRTVPFSTQGSNCGTFFEDFAREAKNAQIESGESFNNLPVKYDRAVENKITRWLNRIGANNAR